MISNQKEEEHKLLINKDHDTAKIKEVSTPGCYIKKRYILVVLGFLCSFNLRSLKTNLNLAIVGMVNTTKNFGNDSNTCPGQISKYPSIINTDGVFNWNSIEQGLLLGCCYYGYVVTNIPGAWLSKRYGFKVVIGVSMILASIITLCTPVAAYSSFELVVALRILLGFVQGVTFPSLIQASSQWAPPLERSVFIGIAFSGTNFGACVTFPLAGLLAHLLGWEAVFYFTGGFALVLSIVWFAMIYGTPNAHPKISEEEKTYITDSIGLENQNDKVGAMYIPWKSILTSLPVLAIISGHFSATWGDYTLLTMLPTYLSSILNFNIATSGALSALPYILRGTSASLGGFVIDIIRKRGIISATAIRKISTTLALAVPALLVALVGYLGCNAAASVALLALSLGFNGLIVPSCLTNAVDISPQYGSIIIGISNTIASLCGILTPQVIGFILSKGNNIYQWRVVFWLSAAIYVFGAIIYLIFGTAEKQQWDRKEITNHDMHERLAEEES